MAGTYTIEQLGQKAVWDNDANKGDYPAKLQGDDREVLFFHDSTSDFDPPKIGDEAFGEIEKDKRGQWRFKRKSRPKGGGGRGGGGYTPTDIARMTRSHSQEMAVRLIAATGAAQGLDPAARAEAGPFLNGVVRRLADWFDQDVKDAETRVAGAQQVLGEEVPADRTGLNGNPDDDIKF